MKKNLYLFALLISLTITHGCIAQEQKPKVVLVLSGGGAKGLAHIPLLQALDSLHIVPDLIIGNSMGSVIGGMYAMGYSGDSIQKIAQNIDWDKVLGGNKSLKSVSAEEKSEYERYLVGIGIKDGKPTSVSSLINDQYLREFLTELTFPVYNVKDFDNLPIPFRAMATDVVYGKEVVLSKGNLAFAMRSSMSLPAIFKTMPYDKTLLVDGGVMNNFPTDVAKKMGADIIIGSDVGGGMEPIDKLDSFIAVLMQTSMFPSNIKDPDNRKLCDILVDHLPNLRFSTSDFAKSNEIYKDGKIATTLNLDALLALAAKVNKFKQREHELPKVDSEFVLDTIVYKNISKENIPLVVARTNIKTKTKYTTKELTAGINGAMGTNLFNQITYSYFVHDGDKIGLLINGLEFAKNQLNASLHYDTYRGVGLILNYNARNVLAESSRLIVTADIAEQPKLRVDFQKNFGKREEWWWKTELYGALLKQEIFVDGKSVDNMRYSSFEFNNEVNLNLNSVNSYFGFGLNYGYTVVNPKNDPDINDNVLSLKKYNYGNAEVGAHYVRNGLNKVFFATEGTLLKANVSRSFHNDISIAFTETDSTDFSGVTNGFSKVGFAFEKRLPLKKTVTGIIGVNTNFIFQDKQTGREGSFSNYGYAAKYFVGGFNPSSGSNRFVFPGLHEDELSVTQFMALKVAAQLNPMGKIYITPHFDVASVGFGDFNDYIRDFSHAKGNWDEKRDSSLLMSGGAAISYQSILGPIHFDTSWINNIDKMRLFFSVGFSFNPAK